MQAPKATNQFETNAKWLADTLCYILGAVDGRESDRNCASSGRSLESIGSPEVPPVAAFGLIADRTVTFEEPAEAVWVVLGNVTRRGRSKSQTLSSRLPTLGTPSRPTQNANAPSS